MGTQTIRPERTLQLRTGAESDVVKTGNGLIEATANANTTNHAGNTALHAAARHRC